ncbi:MAG: aldose 1-epimerase family protein [Bacteroidia bacterium]|jgi:galactose mutarotase-like enzyme|nr:aldose 1-epimerase family protein [Bacteroidia bacterium]
MLFTLQSDEISIRVNSRGAELCSIKSNTGFEYLWQANPLVWPRHAPVLFPVVGKLKNNQFVFKQKTYTLNQHGFARDLDFLPIICKCNELSFLLTSNENTKASYPFDFKLQLSYVLNKNTLICSYKVENTGTDCLFFSLGAHPGFSLAPKNNEEYPYLEFEKEELLLNELQSGLISETMRLCPCPNKRLHLRAELFKNDALVMANHQINAISLFLNATGRKVSLSCRGWPYFGIWSKPNPANGNLDFVCLEPWHGLADTIQHRGKLEDKTGILKLQPAKVFETAFELSFY